MSERRREPLAGGRLHPRGERFPTPGAHRRLQVLCGAVVAAGMLLVLLRLAPDVHGKPLFEDEAVTGLISVEGLRSVLRTVVWDRGGAPLHFALAQIVLHVDASAAALRWLSVVFAMATVPVSFDLGRRLGGRTTGVLAAWLTAASGLLAVYGTWGRMYALYAFAGAVACDLFVRAVQRPTARTAAAAAAGAWLLPATHPYGGIVVAVEALVAAVLWRGRPLRPAWPALAITASMAVFLIGDLRLAARFRAGSTGSEPLSSPSSAARQLWSALAGFTGERGVLAGALALLGLAGLVLCARRLPGVALFVAGSLVAPGMLALAARVPSVPAVSTAPRHLIYGLAPWCALVALGTVRVASAAHRRAGVAAAVAVGMAAAATPVVARDLRTDVPYWARVGQPAALHAPVRWLGTHARRGDLLFPYSVVYLAALPATQASRSLPRAQAATLRAALADAARPVPGVVVAVPLDGAAVDRPSLRRGLPAGSELGLWREWLLVRVPGPFGDEAGPLRVIARTLDTVRSTTRGTRDLDGYLDVSQSAVDRALAGLLSDRGAEEQGAHS